VMAAVARACPQPLERHILVPVKKKYQYVRMKEMLASALKPMGRPLYPHDGGNAVGSGLFDSSTQGATTPRQMMTGTQLQQGRQYPLVSAQRKGSVNVP
jgi:SAGA-associated factor 73